MPQSTVEVRWFGRLGENERVELERALERVGKIERQPDEYLIVPSALDFGIKLRGGASLKLELKGRRLDLGYHVFGQNVIGRVEGWTKWSYDAPGALESLGPWPRRRVHKARAQRHYAVEANERLTRTAERPNQRGGSLEAALLELDGHAYWTFAVEAFPDDSDTFSRASEFVTELLSLLEELDLASFGSGLTKAASQSYPEWLSRVK